MFITDADSTRFLTPLKLAPMSTVLSLPTWHSPRSRRKVLDALVELRQVAVAEVLILSEWLRRTQPLNRSDFQFSVRLARLLGMSLVLVPTR